VTWHTRDLTWQATITFQTTAGEKKQITKACSSERAAVLKYNELMGMHKPEHHGLLHDVTRFDDDNNDNDADAPLLRGSSRSSGSRSCSSRSSSSSSRSRSSRSHSSSSSSSSSSAAAAAGAAAQQQQVQQVHGLVPQTLQYTAQHAPTMYKNSSGTWGPIPRGARCGCGQHIIAPGALRIKQEDRTQQFPTYFLPKCFFGETHSSLCTESTLIRLTLAPSLPPLLLITLQKRRQEHASTTT